MPLIDFSKIALKETPPKAAAPMTPAKGRKIDFNAIKFTPIPAPKQTPVSTAVRSSTPFIGRPLVTPVEQQRMKAATPKPTSSASLWLNGKTVEQRTLEGKQMAAAFAGKSFFDGFKEGVDSYNNATAKGFMGSAAPAEGGITGNRWVDLAGSLATMGAVIQTGVQVVGGLVSAINFTRAMNSKWNWPTVEGGVASNGLAVRVAQANPKLDEGTASSIASLVARTGGNTTQLNALASNTSTLSRSLNQISLASQNPTTIASNVIPSAARAIAQTGIFQAIPMPAGLVHSTAPAIPMGGGTLPAPVSLQTPSPVVAPVAKVAAPAVKSYADIMAKEEAMGAALNTTPRAVDKTIPAIDIKKANLVDVTAKVDLKSVQVKFPTATNVFVDTKRGTVLFTNGATPLEAIGVDKPQLKTWYGIEGAKLLGEITQPVQPVAGVATIPKQPWQEVIQKLPEEIQSSILKEVRGVKIVKGREAEGGRFDQNAGIVYVDESETKNPATLAHELMHSYVFHLDNVPFIADFIRAKFPPNVAVKYLAKNESGANYSEFSQEDVTVALTNYFFDPAKNKPEVNAVIKQYYGPAAPVVAQVAPTLSKMETTAANIEGLDYPESVDIAARKVADAAQLKSPAYIRNKKITDDLAKRGIMRGSSLTDNPDLKEATRVWSNAYDVEVRRLTSTPDLSTTPQKGTATTISNQKTGISTSTPVSPQGEAKTGAEAVKWGKWIDAVGSRRTSGVGTGQVDTIKTPVTYRLGSGEVTVRTYAPEVTADRGIAGPFLPDHGKILEIKGNSRSYYLLHRGTEGHRADYAYVVVESRSGGMMGHGTNAHAAISNAQEIINAHTDDFDTIIEKSVQDHGELANVTNEPFAVTKKILPAAGMTMTDVSTGEPLTIAFVRKDGVFYETKDGTAGMAKPHEIGTRYQLQPMTSTSAPASAPAIGNATPAHGLIDYSKIELNGTTSVTSPAVLKSVSNTGKGFDNYIQNTPGTKDTSLSPFAKFKAIRDGYIRFIANEYNWFFKSPLGGEWMTIAVAADDIMLEEYKNPFYINEAGEQVFVEGEFGPAILSRYLKASDVINKRYLQDPNGVDLVDAKGKKIHNPNYGKPDFGVFLQNLQRAGIPIEATKELGADKTNLAQQHIADAWISLKNFQKNLPQLFAKYMAQAQEIGDANARLLPEFYKGIISPETYANDKANPHYYVSLSAGKTDIFDRSSVAPLERAHGLTNLDEVVPPLEGLMDAYVAAIRAQGINRAKIKTVEWNKSSEVATTVLSDSIVHLWKDGVDRAFEVHDKDAGASIRNLTRSKWEVPSLVKMIFTLPTTLMRLAATGVNIAFGAFNPVRDIIQAAGLVPFTPTGLVKGTVKAFKSPGLSQWSKDYRDPTRPTGTKVTEAVKKIVEFLSIPSNVGESLSRDVIAESIGDRGGTYLDQFYGYHAGTGFFALHGTFFNDFISGLVPFTRATIAVVRAAYRNAFYGLPIGGKGGTFSGKQGAEKIFGKNFLATIIFTIIEIAAIKAAGKEKEYRLLRDRASNFYLYQPSGNWVRLSVPILSAPIKAIVESLYGFESDPIDVAEQTLNVIPGLGALMLPPVLTTYLQYKFNINFFTGSPINTKYDTPAKNPLEAAIMKLGYTEEQADMALRSFFADIPSQVQYVFEMVTQGTSTQAFPLTKRFIVKDPTTSSNAAVDDFYALVDAVKASKNPALEHYVNGKASDIGKLIKNAKLYPAEAKLYMTTATDNIIATFATIAENPDAYGIKKYGPFSWRPSGNYEELAP